MDKTFYVEYSERKSYPVQGNEATTFETVFDSQKCFFMPGTSLTIKDEEGTSKMFVVPEKEKEQDTEIERD